MDDQLNEQLKNWGALDNRIVLTLARAPEVKISADFAARVAAAVPARRLPLTVKVTHYGRMSMAGAMVVLLIVMVALASHSAANSPLWLAIEWTACAQFMALGVWWSFQHEDAR